LDGDGGVLPVRGRCELVGCEFRLILDDVRLIGCELGNSGIGCLTEGR
jgi:hypothetical protein